MAPKRKIKSAESSPRKMVKKTPQEKNVIAVFRSRDSISLKMAVFYIAYQFCCLTKQLEKESGNFSRKDHEHIQNCLLSCLWKFDQVKYVLGTWRKTKTLALLAIKCVMASIDADITRLLVCMIETCYDNELQVKADCLHTGATKLCKYFCEKLNFTCSQKHA